ncbi:UDP-glycosyltransferase 73C6-like [Camellia sinensis]|uniref:UDP-glycosyltransferase 73C6-like n=1 Tax=Camellia sinensis TaxID=4442 RepID=UPI001036C78C|nr:UDP-glycosyltransferase 73C6-like [Camellia sinensis]
MGPQPLPQLHFVLIPLMGQGHLIPMADIAKLLAQRGVIVTVITTPLNTLRIQPISDPSIEAGLPEGTETLDTVPSLHSFKNFYVAISMLQQPLVQIFEQFNPRPSCVISDKYLVFTADIARKFGIPRIVFDGTSCWRSEGCYNGFEERTKDRGLLIRGWAPQVLILSHRAIGGFLTHCGWNSTLEGVCAGLPMVTWPIFAEQFFNEKLIVQVLGIGVGVGAKVVVHLCKEEKFGMLVKRENMKKAVEEVMDEWREGEERRKKARQLQGKAKKAMESGGSSYSNLTLLVEDIMQLAEENQAKA